MFGDDQDRFRKQKDELEQESKFQVTKLTARTDASGRADFKDVPTGLYVIEVKGNENL